MLKITIANEEVLCSNDFTINKEMLNTPSVILNNVYPKSWELNKDYTTNFYYPNDYEQCLISDDTYYPYEEGITVEGTSFTLTDVDTSKESELMSVKGQTTQNGTPTPTTPVPINVVSGRQDVQVCGNNLFNPNNFNLGTSNGITSTVEDDHLVLNGTASSTAYVNFSASGFNGSCTWGIKSDVALGNLQIQRTGAGVVNITPRTTWNKSTLDSTNVTGGWLSIPSGTTLTNCKVYLYVGKGTLSSIEYEPYKGNTYEINLGKNLLINTATSQTINGITYTVNDDKSITANGTATAHSVLNLYGNLTLQAGTYMFSGCPSGGSWSTYSMGYGSYNDSGNGATFTKTENYTGQPYIRIGNGTTVNNLTFKPMIEKGNTKTTYAPYKTPIELCKIENYQDRIYKNSGKNLFDEVFRQGNRWAKGLSDTTRLFTTQNYYVESGKTYTMSTTLNTSTYKWAVNINDTEFPQPVGTALEYDSGWKTTSSFTFTPSQSGYLGIVIATSNGSGAITPSDISSYTFMLNEGSTALPYEPYGSGTWYLTKYVGKVVLNGSENWATWYQTSNSNIGFYYTMSGMAKIGNERDYNNALKCNRFSEAQSRYDIYIGTTEAIKQCGNTGTQYIALGLAKTRLSDWSTNAKAVESLKAWLSTHNTTVYYVLATPTTTEITDSELISQLESIELLEGLNNIGISTPYLPFIMTLRYNHQEEHTDSDLIFCGVVKNSGQISLNPRQPHYSTLQILDYKTFLSEGELDTFVISNKTVLEAIQMIIDDISQYGFELGTVSILNENDIIGAYSTKDKSAYDVFNYIADITQSRWTTRVLDKGQVAIDFYDPSLMEQGTAIDYTQTWFKNNNIIDMSFNYGTWDYRNKQVMTSQEVYGSITQNQIINYDGYATQIMTEFPIGQINAIYVNGVGRLFSTNEEKNIGLTADFYYSPGDNFFERNMSIGAGSQIIISYIPIVEGRQIVTNASEISRVATATGVKGIVSRYENRNDATTSDELQKIGQSYIKYKGEPEITLTVKTESNLWEIGQRVQFNAPIEELDTEYMVKKKAINYVVTANKIFYTFELSSSFNSESAINYFDNQRAKANGNIKKGQYVSRNVDLEEEAQIIFYDTTATTTSITGNNVLQSNLETILGG